MVLISDEDEEVRQDAGCCWYKVEFGIFLLYCEWHTLAALSIPVAYCN